MSNLNNRDRRPTFEKGVGGYSGITCAICNFAPKRSDGSDAAIVRFDHPLKLVCEFCFKAITSCVRAAKPIS